MNEWDKQNKLSYYRVYRRKNRRKLREYAYNYYHSHKARISKLRKRRVYCNPCNEYMNLSSYWRHLQSDKHKENLED